MKNLHKDHSARKKVILTIVTHLTIAIAIALLFEKHISSKKNAFNSAHLLEAVSDHLGKESFSNARKTLSGVALLQSVLDVATGSASPDNEQLLTILNATRAGMKASIVYVMNTNGLTVGCTPYGDNKSLTGNNYAFRPYFSKAIKSGKPSFYAANGVTTGKRGMYISVPINKEEDIAGVLVAKLGVDSTDITLLGQSVPMALVSHHGVVFAANVEGWVFKTVLPVSSEEVKSIRETRQFGSEELKPLGLDFSKSRVIHDSRSMTIEKISTINDEWILFGLFHPAGFNKTFFAITALLLVLFITSSWHGTISLLRLRSSEHNLTELAWQSRTISWVVDTEGIFTYVSPVAKDIIKYNPAELLNKVHIYDLHPRKGRNKFKNNILSSFSQREPIKEMLSAVEKENGKVIWMTTNANPVINDKGKLTGYKGSSTDITERAIDVNKSNEFNDLQTKLLTNDTLENKLKTITDAVVKMVDADFARIWLINKGDRCDTCQHSDTEKKEYLCANKDKCLHLTASSGRYTHLDGGHSRIPFGCYKIGQIASGTQDRFLTNDVTADPQVHQHKWAYDLGLVSFAGYRLHDRNGDTLGVLALFAEHPIRSNTDAFLSGIAGLTSQVITNSKDSQELIQIKLAIDSISDAVGIATATGQHFYQNSTFTRMFGYELSDFKTIRPQDLYSNPDIANETFETIMAGNNYEEEVLMKSKTGDEMLIHLRATSVKDKSGKVIALIGIHSDISERKATQNAMIKAHNETEQLNNLMMGREMRGVELKHEVNALLKELGRNIKYKSFNTDKHGDINKDG